MSGRQQGVGQFERPAWVAGLQCGLGRAQHAVGAAGERQQVAGAGVVAKRREVCGVAREPTEVAGVDAAYRPIDPSVELGEIGTGGQVFGQPDPCHGLVGREPIVHRKHGLVVDELYGIAVVGKGFENLVGPAQRTGVAGHQVLGP